MTHPTPASGPSEAERAAFSRWAVSDIPGLVEVRWTPLDDPYAWRQNDPPLGPHYRSESLSREWASFQAALSHRSAEVESLRATLGRALGHLRAARHAMSERRGYCAEAWGWKYADVWDAEDHNIDAFLAETYEGVVSRREGRETSEGVAREEPSHGKRTLASSDSSTPAAPSLPKEPA